MRSLIAFRSYTILTLTIVSTILFLRGVLRTRSPHHTLVPAASRPLRIAVYDPRPGGGHEEVLAPLLYTLGTIKDLKVDVYRTSYKHGIKELLGQRFDGHYRDRDDLFRERPDGRSDLHDIDVLLLLTGEIDLPFVLNKIELGQHKHLRIISVVHRVNGWSHIAVNETGDGSHHINRETLDFVNSLKTEGASSKLSFMTLSPHVQSSMFEWLSSNMTSTSGPRVATFVPIMPLPARFRSANTERRAVTSAVIQGYMLDRWRAYGRIFGDLVRQVEDDPSAWMSLNARNLQRSPAQRRASSSTPFNLDIVGKRLPTVGNMTDIPEALANVVHLREDLPYAEYYRKLGDAAILIPAFPRPKRYTSVIASSSIPAAIMARVPVLVSQREYHAYSYLRHPAYVLREHVESEVHAIARLRLQGTLVGGSQQEWEIYEEALLQQNRRAIVRLLDV